MPRRSAGSATLVLMTTLLATALAADPTADAATTEAPACTSATPSCVTAFCAGKADGLYANPYDAACASYIQCYNSGTAGVYQACPSGLVFNPTAKYCDWSYNYKCPGSPAPAPSPPPPPPPPPPTTTPPPPPPPPTTAPPPPPPPTTTAPPPPPPATTTPPPSGCTSATSACITSYCGSTQGPMPNPWDKTCASFINCGGAGGGAVTACPAGTLFSPTAKYCDWANNVSCGSSPTPAPSPTSTPAPTPAPTTPAPTPAPTTPAPSPTSTPSPTSPSPPPPPTPSTFVFSPYKDVGINMNWNTYNASTKVTGTLQPLSTVMTQNMPAASRAITLAFATGACGSENWAGIAPASFKTGTVLPLAAAGIKYIISTGGAAGAFTCASPAAFVSFVQYYYTPQMVGVDFDIEAGQTATDIANLVAGAKAAAAQYPSLRFSFTLATLGANTTTASNLNTQGDSVMKAIASAGLNNAIINLMVMDYGAAGPYTCVVSKTTGKCDMGASAIAASESLAAFYKIPYSRIELTPMIGGNDVVENVFYIADATTMSTYVRTKGLAGVHYWSWDRDVDCAPGYSSSTCNSYGTAGTLGFLKAFLSGLGLA